MTVSDHSEHYGRMTTNTNDKGWWAHLSEHWLTAVTRNSLPPEPRSAVTRVKLAMVRIDSEQGVDNLAYYRVQFFHTSARTEMTSLSLNHVIILSNDQKKASQFLADIFGLPGTYRYSHFDVVTIDGISFDYAKSRGPVQRQHFAFLVSEEEFDQIFARIKARNVPYWADPKREKPNEICHDDGGRGIYFADPSDHNFEIITRPYSRADATRTRNAASMMERDGASE